MKSNKIFAALAIVIAVAAIAMILKGSTRVRATPDALTFERDVTVDMGTALSSADVVSVSNHVRMSEVFSLERIARYGGYRHTMADNPSGGAVTITLRWKTGDKVTREEKLVLPEDTTENNNSARNRLVVEKRTEFDRMAREFCSPIRMSYSFGLIVDTTEGVDDRLADRVREVVGDLRAAELAKAGNAVTMGLYHVTESSYMGGRRRIDLAKNELSAGLEWLLSPEKEEDRSSALRGLAASLGEMSKAGGNIRVDIFSDGLENTDTLSVYKTPKLLDDEEGWAKLDAVANLAGLELKGVNIHLHPLPPKSARHEAVMERGLAYLANRLAKAGATVRMEPL